MTRKIFWENPYLTELKTTIQKIILQLKKFGFGL